MIKKCPNCGSEKVIMFDADNNMCQKCQAVFDSSETIEIFSGVERIAAERHQQITKHGYTADHDDDWFNAHGELAQAAGWLLNDLGSTAGYFRYPSEWNEDYQKKLEAKSNIEKLVIAGALIAAEVDRLCRKESTTKNTKEHEEK